MIEDRELPTIISETAFYFPVPFLGGLEPLLKMQKATLEMYARQTTAAINMMQQAFPMIPATCVNAAERCVIELLRTQTATLNSIGKRIGMSTNVSDGAPAPVNFMPFQELLQDSAEQCLTIHRKFLDVFTCQIQSFSAFFRWPGM